MTKLPDIPLDALPQLLDAEILLDQMHDTPANHIDEALAIGIAAKQAGLDLDDMQRVRLKRTS